MEISLLERRYELWKPVSRNNDYAVSNLGRVACAASGITITVVCQSDNGRGYKLVSTGPRVKRKNYYVHRLVAEAFIPNPDNLPEVNHKDGDKSNNRAANLEWVTLQQNRDHAVRNNLISRGERSPHAKLKEKDVLDIIRALKEDPKLNKTAIGRKYGVNCTTIIKLSRGERWKHITANP
jgi:hypothetical protein